MAEYYTIPEADAKFALKDHTHNLEDLSGAELPASRIEVPESVAADFDNAFTLDEALASIADQLGDVSAPDLSGYPTTAAMNAALAGKSNTNHTHAPADIGAAAASHTHDYAASNHGHAYSDLTGLPTIPTIPSSLPANGGNADTVDGKHAADFATADHTHSGFAASSHNHPLSAITGLLGLLATDAEGNVSSSASTSDVLAHIKALPSGMHTVYAQASAPNAPNSSEGWRFLVHKTGSATYGWVIAFGTNGSIYTNYLNNGTWRGWKALYEAAPAPLWSGGANGGYYMTAGHTVTPTKKLSECRNGWILLWSDYDVGGQANNTDFCTTIIPKRAYSGQVWNGAMWYCDVPSYAAGTATDSETRVIKVLQIYDNRIIGTENNAAAPRNDVVLRAVYEF